MPETALHWPAPPPATGPCAWSGEAGALLSRHTSRCLTSSSVFHAGSTPHGAPGGAARLLQGLLPKVVQACVRTRRQKPLFQPSPGETFGSRSRKAAQGGLSVSAPAVSSLLRSGQREECQPQGGNWNYRCSQQNPGWAGDRVQVPREAWATAPVELVTRKQ